MNTRSMCLVMMLGFVTPAFGGPIADLILREQRCFSQSAEQLQKLAERAEAGNRILIKSVLEILEKNEKYSAAKEIALECVTKFEDDEDELFLEFLRDRIASYEKK